MVKLPPQVKKALRMLRRNGFEAYIIGGCVRDRLLGEQPKDYDITTSAHPEETERVFEGFRVIETGIKHGTVTVLIDEMPLEITTYRIDSDYVDNRHPESVTFTKDLREDTARRDFTMNAVAVDENGAIVDFHGGREDIERRIIRCVGDPDKRFGEDALRILRAVRFSSVLGFEIEQRTKEAVFSNKELLKNISSERIASELLKLVCGKNARSVIVEYIDVLSVVIPELAAMKGFDQHNFHHIYDVLEHTAAAVENTPADSPVLRLAALFHDVGKPLCFSMKDGVGHFYGHASVGADMTNAILSRLKLDNATRETVVKLIKLHDVQIEETETAVKRCMNRHTPEIFFLLLQLKKADTLALAPKWAVRCEYLDRLKKTAEDILSRKECFSMKQLAVNGRDLITIGYAPGKELGLCLSDMLERVISGELANERDSLIGFARSRLCQEAGRR